jgi:hypothetical protein
VLCSRERTMGTRRDHRDWAEKCVAKAQAAADPQDKALWLTLAQSWVRLSEHAAHAASSADAVGEAMAAQSAD